MANIADIRKQYPQYADLSDLDIAKGFHTKFYSDIPFDEFSQQLGLTTKQTTPKAGLLDFLPKGVPEWMQSKPGQGWDDVNAQAAGGDVTNPMAYLSEAQKTEQGPAMQAVGQGVNRALQVGAGIAKGAVINPAAAVAQVAGGETGRQFAEEAQKSYEQQRATSGAEGFDFAEVAGGIISPVNKLIPGLGAQGTVLGRGALQGVIGATLNPVTGENLTLEDVVAGKVEQAGIGALLGRIGGGLSEALTPTLKEGTRELIKSGVNVTPGQAFEGAWGGLFRKIEKLDIPTMRTNKDVINKQFTMSIGNEVLSSIDDKLPSNIKNGQQAFGYIQDKISKYYEDSLSKIGKVNPDEQLIQDLANIRKTIDTELADKPGLGKAFSGFMKENIANRIGKDGKLEATDLKKIEEIFRKKLDGMKALDTPGEVMKQAYDDAYKAVKSLILRNDKDGTIAKANEAYMKRARFMEAVNKNVSEIQGAQGNFSPAQMAQVAAKQGTPAQAAAGKAPLQSMATRALDIVGDTTPEGTKFREAMIVGKLSGLGALGLFKPVYAVPILVASGIPYQIAKQMMKDPGKVRLAVQKAVQDNPQILSNIASQQGLFGAGKE